MRELLQNHGLTQRCRPQISLEATRLNDWDLNAQRVERCAGLWLLMNYVRTSLHKDGVDHLDAVLGAHNLRQVYRLHHPRTRLQESLLASSSGCRNDLSCAPVNRLCSKEPFNDLEFHIFHLLLT